MNTETCLGVTFNKKSYKKVTLDVISLLYLNVPHVGFDSRIDGSFISTFVRPRSGDHSRKGDRVEDRQGQVSFIAILSFILITRIYICRRRLAEGKFA